MIPPFAQDISWRKPERELRSAFVVQHLTVVLIVTIISPGGANFEEFHKKLLKHLKLHILNTCGMLFFPGWVFEDGVTKGKGRSKPDTTCHM